MSALPLSPTTTTRPPAINDISHRAHVLAQILDRLSSGEYSIKLVKPDILSSDWDIVIVRSELIQRVSLSNKKYVAE